MYRVKSNKTFGFLILVCFIVGMAFIAPVSALTHITDATGLQNMNLNLAEDYVLDNDIDLSGVTWTPIATGGQFLGELDGAGYTISNLNINAPGSSYVGLFSKLGSQSCVKNLNMDNVVVVGDRYCGALSGGISMTSVNYATACVDNVKINNFSITASSNAGGIYGYGTSYTYLNISNCEVTDGKVLTSNNYAGGISGYAFSSNSNVLISNCIIERIAITTSSNYAGGISGIGGAVASTYIISDCSIKDCIIIATTSMVGGISGQLDTGTSGKIDNTFVNNCVISSSGYAGGFSALSGSGSLITIIMNSDVVGCTISATSGSSAGIVAYPQTGTTTITNCDVSDSTIIGASIASGIISNNTGTTTITNCDVSDTNIKGTTTTNTFGPIATSGCTSSGITNIAGLKIKAVSLNIITPKNSQPVFTLQRQGAVVRTDGSGFVDTLLGYAWTWGDGSTGVDFTDTPTHSYTATGDYTVSVIITNKLDLSGSSASNTFTLSLQNPTILTPASDTVLTKNVEYTFSSDESNDIVWDFGDGGTSTEQNATHTYLNTGNYDVILTVTTAFGVGVTQHTYLVVDSGNIVDTDAIVLSTEELSISILSTQKYNPTHEYGLVSSVLDLKYTSSADAYMVSGTTPYHIDSKSGNIVPISMKVGGDAVLCDIGLRGIAIWDDKSVISYYSYSTQTRKIIDMKTGITALSLGESSSGGNVLAYTTDANTYFYMIDADVIYTADVIYDSIVSNPQSRVFASFVDTDPYNVTINQVVGSSISSTSHVLDMTINTTIQSIQSILNTNNFVIRTTDKIFIIETEPFSVVSKSLSNVPPFSEVRADAENRYMGLKESTVYFVDNIGNLSTSFTSIAHLNTLAVSSDSGIWCAVGGNDRILSLLGKTADGWAVADQITFPDRLDKVVLSTGGYYSIVVSADTLILLSQATPNTTDQVLTTKYYLQITTLSGGIAQSNTDFTFGLQHTAGRTLTTDTLGTYIVEVLPGKTYVASFSDGRANTVYTANNFALQYLILSKPSSIPVSSGLTSNVSLDYRLVHMSYSDSDGRNNLVTFTIWNATTILQTYSSVTNNVSYIYDATEIEDSYLAVVLHVSNPDSGYTYDKSYTVWLKKYADPTNQTGLILPGAKKPLIPAAFWSDTGIPIKLDSELIQLIICGVLMVIAGLFGAQHSAKGALLVAGIAAIFTVLGLLVIDPIWIAMMVVIGVLALFSYARDYD